MLQAQQPVGESASETSLKFESGLEKSGGGLFHSSNMVKKNASLAKKPYGVSRLPLTSVTWVKSFDIPSTYTFVSAAFAVSTCMDFKGISGARYKNNWSSWEFQDWPWADCWWLCLHVFFCGKWFPTPHAYFRTSWGCVAFFNFHCQTPYKMHELLLFDLNQID